MKTVKQFGVFEGKAKYLIDASMKRKKTTTERVRAARAARGMRQRPLALVPAPVATRGFFGTRSVMRKEMKSVDTAVNTYVADTTGTVTLIGGVASGDDINTRDGRKIVMRSVHIRGFLAPVDTDTTSAHCRVLVVYDSQPNGAAISTVANILSAATSLSFNNLDNRSRYKVLIDKAYTIGGDSIAANQVRTGSPSVHTIEERRTFKLPSIYNTTTAVITAISTGALLLVTIGSNGVGAGGVFALACRMRFQDV